MTVGVQEKGTGFRPMTPLEHLVLESVRRLDVADATQIRSNISEMMGSQISEERVSDALKGLVDKELLASTDLSAESLEQSYQLTRGGKLHFTASTSLSPRVDI